MGVTSKGHFTWSEDGADWGVRLLHGETPLPDVDEQVAIEVLRAEVAALRAELQALADQVTKFEVARRTRAKIMTAIMNSLLELED